MHCHLHSKMLHWCSPFHCLPSCMGVSGSCCSLHDVYNIKFKQVFTIRKLLALLHCGQWNVRMRASICITTPAGEGACKHHSHGNLSLYLFRLATTIFLANAMSSEHGDLLSFSNICYNENDLKMAHSCRRHSNNNILVGQCFSLQIVLESQSSLYSCQLSWEWQWQLWAHGQAHWCPHRWCSRRGHHGWARTGPK